LGRDSCFAPIYAVFSAAKTGEREIEMAAMITTPRLMAVGGGTLAELPGILQRLGLANPLIVTDPFLERSGHLERATARLDDAQIPWAVFSDTVADPTTAVVETGTRRLVEGNFDSLIAIGGGSSIDTAKAMSVLAANSGRMRDYKVPAEIPQAGPPIVAIPTTAGTGSEATRFTVITDSETDEKMLIAGLACCPLAAIVDYELTLSMPLRLTADTGLDSLTHAIEAYVSRRANPFTDGLAKNAMGLIARHIRTACAEPDNRAAREAMMLGATTAGMAFSNASVCLVHGMSRPIGAFFHVPHGLSNAMLLPEITAFSVPAALERYADCARAMGVAEEGEGSQGAVARLLDELRRLNEDLKVPTPRAWGIDAERYEQLLPVMADQALASGSPGNNPRIPTSAEIIGLYRRVYG
jgi:alcohol dehydrogenase class IV